MSSAPSESAWLNRALLGYVVIMLVLFLLPVTGGPLEPTQHIDKVIHFGIFLGFAVLFHLARSSRVVQTLIVSIVFAAVIEGLQLLVPYRDGDWYDLAAGAAGGIVGAALARWSARYLRPIS